ESYRETPRLERGPAPPSEVVLDEVLLMVMLLPLAYSNLRAPVRQGLSCTDASEEGGAACEASAFTQAVDQKSSDTICSHFANLVEESGRPAGSTTCCSVCGAALAHTSLERAPCPAGYGALACGTSCMLAHRRERRCTFGDRRLPAFAEGFWGPQASLSWVVARAGVEISRPLDKVLPPYPDVTLPCGKAFIAEEFDHEAVVVWEHWRPGRANKVVHIALGRLRWRAQNGGFAVIAHPRRSWIWNLPAAMHLQSLRGVYFTVVWAHHHGAVTATEIGLLHNSGLLHAKLHAPGKQWEVAQAAVAASTLGSAATRDCMGTMFRAYAEVVAEELLLVQGSHLKYVGIGSKTLLRYRTQVARLFRYLQALEKPLPSTIEELDLELSEYINHLWLDGDSHGYAGALVSGLHRFVPRLRAILATSRQYLRNWERTLVRKRAFPLPRNFVIALAGVAYAYQRPDLSAVLLTGFLCMLRTMEAVTLQVRQIAFFPNLEKPSSHCPTPKLATGKI
ncbi:unnamed protein product, partial [Prorocentrum cordatum]